MDGSHCPCPINLGENIVSDHGIEHVVRSIMVTINAKPDLGGVLGDILSDGIRLGIAHVLLSWFPFLFSYIDIIQGIL